MAHPHEDGAAAQAAARRSHAPAREAKRSERKRNAIPSVAIVGYTNAGKSSLLNRLTSAGVLVENTLFTERWTTVRAVPKRSTGRVYTLTDTVGFVQEPAAPARRGVPLDAGRGGRRRRAGTRRGRLPSRPRGATRDRTRCDGATWCARREIVVFSSRRTSSTTTPDWCCAVSGRARCSCRRARARASIGCTVIEGRPAAAGDRGVRALVPYERGDLINAVHESGHIVSAAHEEGDTAVHAHVSERLAAELAPYAL